MFAFLMNVTIPPEDYITYFMKIRRADNIIADDMMVPMNHGVFHNEGFSRSP